VLHGAQRCLNPDYGICRRIPDCWVRVLISHASCSCPPFRRPLWDAAQWTWACRNLQCIPSARCAGEALIPLVFAPPCTRCSYVEPLPLACTLLITLACRLVAPRKAKACPKSLVHMAPLGEPVHMALMHMAPLGELVKLSGRLHHPPHYCACTSCAQPLAGGSSMT